MISKLVRRLKVKVRVENHPWSSLSLVNEINIEPNHFQLYILSFIMQMILKCFFEPKLKGARKRISSDFESQLTGPYF